MWPDAVASARSVERVSPDVLELSRTCHDAWSSALGSAELIAVAEALAAAAISVEACVAESARITDVARTRRGLEAIRDAVADRLAPLPPGSFERFVLGHTVLSARQRVDAAPVDPAVKRLGWSGLSRFADDRITLDVSQSRFAALCMIATARRFAAGQFDWEPSGLPLSWLPRIRPASALMRALSTSLRRHAFKPAFFIHLPVTYPVRALLEREALKSYYRMAQSMALQPEMRGLIASSWLHSPDTFAVSPHLAWLNKVFADNGAVIATMGRADHDCGALDQSVERRRAFDEGRFTPTLGLIIWPRREMLAWAEAHPELDR